MSHVKLDATTDNAHIMPDMIPPKLRTALYMAVAVGGILLLLISGLAPIWFDADTAQRLVDSAKVVSGALATIGGFVGYAYRPTR